MHSGWKSQKKSHSINVDKSLLKRPKMVTFGKLWKVEACGQTILQDRSLLIDQKLIENTKIQKFKFDILSNWVNCLMSCSRTFKNHLIFSFKNCKKVVKNLNFRAKNGTALHDFLPYVFFSQNRKLRARKIAVGKIWWEWCRNCLITDKAKRGEKTLDSAMFIHFMST